MILFVDPQLSDLTGNGLRLAFLNTIFHCLQVDLFIIDSIFLGKLTSIRIGHNGTALGKCFPIFACCDSFVVTIKNFAFAKFYPRIALFVEQIHSMKILI